MAVIERLSDEPYRVRYTSADIRTIANEEKKIPREWINAEGNDVLPPMLAYMKPLILGEEYPIYRNGIPLHISLY